MEDRHDKTDKFKIQAYDTITSPSTQKQSAQFSTDSVCVFILSFVFLLLRNQLNTLSRILLWKLVVPRIAKKNASHFDSEGSSPCLQQPTTCPNPEPIQSSPRPPNRFLDEPF